MNSLNADERRFDGNSTDTSCGFVDELRESVTAHTQKEDLSLSSGRHLIQCPMRLQRMSVMNDSGRSLSAGGTYE